MTRPRARVVLQRLPVQLLLVAAVFAAYMLGVQAWLRATGERLGVVDASLMAPLHAYWDPVAPSAWAVPALAVLGGFLLLAPRLFAPGGLRPRLLLPAAAVLYFAVGLSVSLVDGIVTSWNGRRMPAFQVPYTRYWSEYSGDVHHVQRLGVQNFLAKYAQPRLFEQLALHSRTHPPGGVLFQWLAARSFGPGLRTATWASVGFTALAVVVVYLLGRELHGETVARIAMALLLVTPNFIMYAFTSMDGVFSVFPALSLWLLVRLQNRRGHWLPWGLALGASAAIGSFMTYAAPVFLGVFGATWLALAWRETRAFAHTLRGLGAAALGVAAFYGALAWWAGYDPVAAVLMSVKYDAHLMGATGYETVPRFLNLGFANLFGFLLGIGVALSTVLGRHLAGETRRTLRREPADVFGLALGVALVVLSFSTLFTLEVERVWLFLTPLVAVTAARHLHGRPAPEGHSGLRWVLGVSALQLFIAEALLRTDW